MNPHIALIFGSLLFWSVCSAFSGGEQQSKVKLIKGDYIPPGVSAAELLRARGYLAKEFFFYTKDGYRINMVRGRNPLINKGKSALAGTMPILLVHGTVDAAPTMLSSSTRARPKDFSRHLKRLHKIRSASKLIELLKEDPSTDCLPYLALNFGYEIWLVNRRGFNRSKGRRGHENRTLAEAIISIPAAMLGRGVYPDWFSKERPHIDNDAERNETSGVDEVGLARRKSAKKNKHRDQFGFWKDLFSEHLSLINLPKALTNFGNFQEQFIQTFDPDYWDFSLDEQAKYDVTEAIEFVVEKTGCTRVHAVGLSSGGALLLMAPAETPELASKIASLILWAPALNMGSARDLLIELSNLVGVLQGYVGPFPFVFSQQPLAGILQELCKTDHMQRNLCSRLIDLVFGYSDKQSPITVAMLSGLFEPTSLGELAHLSQFAHSDQPCKFKFNDPKKNIERYGQKEPPCYDLSKIQVEHISVYSGEEDILVSPGDVNVTCSQLSVPVKLKLFGGNGIFVNHAGIVTHEQRARLAQVPSFLDIRRAELSGKLFDEAAECHVRRQPWDEAAISSYRDSF